MTIFLNLIFVILIKNNSDKYLSSFIIINYCFLVERCFVCCKNSPGYLCYVSGEFAIQKFQKNITGV